MNWTKSKPTEAGFYWWRKNQYKQEGIYCVFPNLEESISQENYDRKLDELPEISRYSPINEVKPHNRVFYCRWAADTLHDKEFLDEIGGEWFGPITPPGDCNESTISI